MNRGHTAGDSPAWSPVAGARPAVGDFDGDGKSDIALTGGVGWATIPIAFGSATGIRTVTNAAVSLFPGWAQDTSAKLVTGDFNGDRRTDLALLGGSGWRTIAFAVSKGTNGTFDPANLPIGRFADSARTARSAIALEADVNIVSDIMLIGSKGWERVAYTRM